MLLKLLLISLFLSSCITGQDFSHKKYIDSSIGINFNSRIKIGYTSTISRFVRIKGKRPFFNKTFKYIEELNKQQPDGTHIYKYANPYNNCKDTFIVNQQGIVIKASSEGDDCDA